jgi:hypothetical protein
MADFYPAVVKEMLYAYMGLGFILFWGYMAGCRRGFPNA